MKLFMRFNKLSLWGKLAAVGSVCSILSLLTWLIWPSQATIKIEGVTTHDQSPIIVGGNTTIIEGIPQSVIDIFQKHINEKDIAIKDREIEISKLEEKYKELEKIISNRPYKDEISSQARLKLENGDIEGAEELLLQSSHHNLKNYPEIKQSLSDNKHNTISKYYILSPDKKDNIVLYVTRYLRSILNEEGLLSDSVKNSIYIIKWSPETNNTRSGPNENGEFYYSIKLVLFIIDSKNNKIIKTISIDGGSSCRENDAFKTIYSISRNLSIDIAKKIISFTK